MNKEDIIKEIVTGITSFKIIPFLGAGMSVPCGSSQWSSIIADLKSELNSQTTSFLSVAQEYENLFGREILIARLKEKCELKLINSISLENHMRILAMNPPFVYTTNYDNAIEEAALLMKRKYRKIVSLKDIVDSQHGEKQIIKFHGDFSDPEIIVFTQNDYNRRLTADENPLDILLRSHILGKSVLFLGYGFRDINIDYIFKKHIQLYGAENLPRSYIISFESDLEKEYELKQKNIVTLVLGGSEELKEVLSQIGSDVFQLSHDSQFADMMKPLPNILLTRFEFFDLQKYVDSEEFTLNQKHEKIRETIELKTIPSDIEESIYDFYVKIINGSYDLQIKEAILISFKHTNFTQTKYIIELSFELMKLTEIPEFIFSIENNNWGSDVLMSIEHKLTVVSNDSLENRKLMCTIILAYLVKVIHENKTMTVAQVDRLLDGLKNYGYDEFENLNSGLDKNSINEIVEYILSRYDNSVRSRFNAPSFFGNRRRTALEIMNEISKNMPQELNKI